MKKNSSTEEKLKLMQEVKNTILNFLQDELKINSDALKAYDDIINNPIQNSDPDIKRMREIESIKLRDRIHQLNSYIAVIKRMTP